jgi:hypothetical protein
LPSAKEINVTELSREALKERDQSVFDTVVAHLRKQGKQSLSWPRKARAGRCCYRGPRGLRCAIGVLIPDEFYDKKFEGKTVSQLHCGERLGLPTDNIALLTCLQEAHDSYNHWDMMGLTMSGEKFLAEIGEQFELTYILPETSTLAV